MLAQLFNVVNEVPSGVCCEVSRRITRVGRAAPTAALVKQYDAVFFRIVISAMVGRTATPRSPVQKNHGPTVRVSALLIVDLVTLANGEHAGGIRFDRREHLAQHIGHEPSLFEGANPLRSCSLRVQPVSRATFSPRAGSSHALATFQRPVARRHKPVPHLVEPARSRSRSLRAPTRG
jgi:hypothetical protein